ncbi:MAG TPA: uroporphyrinogen-III synthase [Usitatibacter sp.]|jgi:uroporphyrinogen-III synthase|nr:uroporphyrinogen-III synthase [Usitatibacter sp.]
MNGRLAGLGIVVTRPRAAAEALAAELSREGARVWRLPALAIEPIEPGAELAALLGRLETFDLAVFVSANAVERGLAAARRFGRWPQGLAAAAVGEATAAALREEGVDDVVAPHDRHDSEGLLALPRLQSVRGQNIIVFRGQGGREQLREALESRGARVTYAECYRRVRPEADAAPVAAALASREVHAVSVLSAETLENFMAMVGAEGGRALASVALVVPHPAIGGHRESRRFARVVVSGHGTEALIATLAGLKDQRIAT